VGKTLSQPRRRLRPLFKFVECKSCKFRLFSLLLSVRADGGQPQKLKNSPDSLLAIDNSMKRVSVCRRRFVNKYLGDGHSEENRLDEVVLLSGGPNGLPLVG